MKDDRMYTTAELEEHIRSVYARLEQTAREDGVFRPLGTFFGNKVLLRPKDYIYDIGGEFCYTDDKGYHYCTVLDPWVFHEDVTQDLFEITCWIIHIYIFMMASDYEVTHRIAGQDCRRLLFEKRLQYWSLLGPEYLKREEKEIRDILLWYPYNDDVRLECYKKLSAKAKLAEGIIEEFISLAYECYHKGSLEKAIVYLTKCLRLNPYVKEAREKRGEIYKELADGSKTPRQKAKYERLSQKDIKRMKKLEKYAGRRKKRCYSIVVLKIVDWEINKIIKAKFKKKMKGYRRCMKSTDILGLLIELFRLRTWRWRRR
jgi:tetratricopeptide (TPR) repeat protein